MMMLVPGAGLVIMQYNCAWQHESAQLGTCQHTVPCPALTHRSQQADRDEGQLLNHFTASHSTSISTHEDTVL